MALNHNMVAMHVLLSHHILGILAGPFAIHLESYKDTLD